MVNEKLLLKNIAPLKAIENHLWARARSTNKFEKMLSLTGTGLPQSIALDGWQPVPIFYQRTAGPVPATVSTQTQVNILVVFISQYFFKQKKTQTCIGTMWTNAY